MACFEQELERRLGARRRAFIRGVLVIRAGARRALTLVAPARAGPCVSTTVQEVWSANKAFTWIVHDEDKMHLHDLRMGKLARIEHPPAARIRGVHPAMDPRRVLRRARRSGRDYHQQAIYAIRSAAPSRGAPLRRAVLLPRGLAVVGPAAGARRRASSSSGAAPPVVVDVLTTARSGNVCNLWGSALQPRVLEARRRFPRARASVSR